MWPFVTIWRRITQLFGFINKNHGAVTAIATLVIAALTYTYSTYAKKQWQTMRDANQLARSVFEFSQRAYVTIGQEMARSPIL